MKQNFCELSNYLYHKFQVILFALEVVEAN